MHLLWILLRGRSWFTSFGLEPGFCISNKLLSDGCVAGSWASRFSLLLSPSFLAEQYICPLEERKHLHFCLRRGAYTTRLRWAEETCRLWILFQAPGIEGRWSGFKNWLSHPLAVWSCINHLTTLCLFFHQQRGGNNNTSLRGLLWGLNEIIGASPQQYWNIANTQ